MLTTMTTQHTQASTTLTAYNALIRSLVCNLASLQFDATKCSRCISNALTHRQRLTFQGLAHEEGQEAKLQLAQQVIRLIAKVLLQDVAEQACLVQVEGSKLLGSHARHLHTTDKTQSQEDKRLLLRLLQCSKLATARL